MTQTRRASSISIACVCAAWLFFADLHLAAADPIQPLQRTAFVFPTGLQSKTVPIRIVSGQILMRLAIGDRGLDLVLDFGSPENILDPAVFDGVPTNGDASSSSTRTVESARIGDVTVNGLVFQSVPFFRRMDQATTAVGILGYGLFRNAVVKVDYNVENIELIDAEHFTPPADAAFEEPVDLTTRIPMAHATLGSASGGRFVIDTGTTTDVVFAQLSNRYPAQFTPDHELHDSGSYRYLRQYFPLFGTSEHLPFPFRACP